ncbi:hypothetical protein [Speluncibacter jeojiensis]|uniref:Uncharacterized protein n=1 Tax=Speluncibacter jeojiensis TaxID=2710754 RepID=A0A9X4RIL6_9ACTN|nr:hypothetical protein [Corynebacteriales bacterium D3-21]
MHPDFQNFTAPTIEPAPVPKKRLAGRGRLLAGMGAGLVALAAAGTVGYLIGDSQGGGSVETAAAAAVTPTVSYTGPAAATSTATYTRPLTNADFSLAVTILDQKCFGSAGCVTKYTIDPTFNGSSYELEGRSIQVIYRVEGGEDPQIGNFTMHGKTATLSKSTTIDTEQGATLTATVTNVIES